MLPNGKTIHNIAEDDLMALIRNADSEIKTREYKRELPGGTDEEKREFLSDISSFANASGGFIVYGMDEADGVPTALTGVQLTNPDAEILRLEEIIRSGVGPRLPGLTTNSIHLSNGNYAIIILIPQSWIGPHMVIFKNLSRFFGRNSRGKYQLDVQELRQAFLLSDSITERIRNFRNDRLGKIIAGDTPLYLGEGAKIIYHLIPLDAFQTRTSFDINFATQNYYLLETLVGSPSSYRVNIDGIVTSIFLQDGNPVSYVQLFRTGIIEVVDVYLLREHADEKQGPRRFIPSIAFEESSVNAVSKLLGYQKNAGIEPPIQIFATISGVKGYKFAISQRVQSQFPRSLLENFEIDRDILLLPDITVNSFDNINLDQLLRPIFDALWNAAGFIMSMNYDRNGTRIKK